MRRDKTFARILLIFSIANVVLAAPVVLRQRRFVTDRSNDESADNSTPLPDNALIDSDTASQSSATSGSMTQASPPSSADSLHQDSAPVSVAPQLDDPQPVSGTSELHHVPPSTSGNPPSQDDAPPVSEAAQLHSDPLPGSGSQPLHEDIRPSWHGWSTNTEIEEVSDSEPEVPDVHNDHKGYYHDDYHHFDLDDDELKLNFGSNDNANNGDKEGKPKTFCGLNVECWNWIGEGMGLKSGGDFKDEAGSNDGAGFKEGVAYAPNEAPQLNNPQPVSGTSALHHVPPFTSGFSGNDQGYQGGEYGPDYHYGIELTEDELMLNHVGYHAWHAIDDSDKGVKPVSVAPQLNDPQPVSGTSPSQSDAPPASEAAQLHNDPLPGSGSQPLPEDINPSWHGWSPNSEIEEVAEPEVPDVHNDHQGYYHDDYHHFDLNDDEIKLNFGSNDNDNNGDKEGPGKPKTFCGLNVECWNWIGKGTGFKSGGDFKDEAGSNDGVAYAPNEAPQLNDPQPVSGTSELHHARPSTSGNSPSQDDAPPASEAAQLHNDPLPGSGSQPLHEDIRPSWPGWSPNTEIEEVADSEPEVADVHNDHQGYYHDDYHLFDLNDDEIKLNFAPNEAPQLNDPQPVSVISELHRARPSTSGNSPSQDDVPPVSEAAQLHNDPLPGSGSQPLPEDIPSSSHGWSPNTEIEEVAEPEVADVHNDHQGYYHDDYHLFDLNDDEIKLNFAPNEAPQLNDPQPLSGTSELHHVPPSASGNPPSQDDAPPVSEAAQLHSDPLPGSGSQPLHEDIRPSWPGWSPNSEIEEVAEPEVADVHNDHQGYYHDDFQYFDLDDDEIKLNFGSSDNANNGVKEGKPKIFCGFNVECWNWIGETIGFKSGDDFKDEAGSNDGADFKEGVAYDVMSKYSKLAHLRRSRSFQRTPERDRRHRFSRG